MNNMYDILAKMKLLEGRGSKPDFLDIDKDGDKKEPMKQAAEQAKEVDESIEEADYSAKKARAGKDIGKPGKEFAKIAKSAGERYGSKERGEKVAGAVLAKLRAKEDVNEDDMEEGNDFTGARLAAIRAGKPTFKVDGKTYKVTGDTSDERKQVDEREFHTRDEFDNRAEPGDTYKKGNMTITKTTGGIHVRHETDYDPSKDDNGNDNDDGAPKRRGRPKGTGRKLGAKGPTGRSKLLKKSAIKQEEGLDEEIDVVDQGEYDREGEMARQQTHTAVDAAKELHDILDADENLPEWVQQKIAKAVDMLDTARDYMKSSKAEKGVAEVAPPGAKAERMVKHIKKAYAKDGKLTPKEKSIAYATAWKAHKAGKVEEQGKEEMEETTAGSVATAPAAAAPKKSKGGMQFGKGVYESKLEESYSQRLKDMLTEGMNISASQDEQGGKSLTITATDDDAVKLAQILQLAGMPQGEGYEEVCPACGAAPCGCEEQVEEDLANSPDPQYADTDTMVNDLSGGLNGRKSSGQTTIPVINRDPARQGVRGVAEEIREQTETRLWDLYKKYEGK